MRSCIMIGTWDMGLVYQDWLVPGAARTSVESSALLSIRFRGRYRAVSCPWLLTDAVCVICEDPEDQDACTGNFRIKSAFSAFSVHARG